LEISQSQGYIEAGAHVKVSRFRKVALRWDPERGEEGVEGGFEFYSGVVSFNIQHCTSGLNKWEDKIFLVRVI